MPATRIENQHTGSQCPGIDLAQGRLTGGSRLGASARITSVIMWNVIKAAALLLVLAIVFVSCDKLKPMKPRVGAQAEIGNSKKCSI